MEAALGEVAIRARIEAAHAVFLAVLVGHDDDRQRVKLGIGLDLRDQLDAGHARHVHVGDREVVGTGAKGVPAVHSVDGHLHDDIRDSAAASAALREP